MRPHWLLILLALLSGVRVTSAGNLTSGPHLQPVTLVTTEDLPSPWVALTPVTPYPQALTLTITAPPVGGRIEVDGAYRARFLPDPDWHGESTFRVRACQPDGTCAEMENSLRVHPAPDLPEIPTLTLATARNEASHWLAVPIIDPDPPAPGGHRLEVVNPPPLTQGKLELAGERLRFVPADDWSGTTRADLVACHSDGRCGPPAPISLQVLPATAPPDCAAPTLQVQAGAPPTSTALVSPVGVPLRMQIRGHAPGLTVSQPQADQVAVSASATLRDPSWYLLEVCADDDHCTTCRGTVDVTAINHPPTLTVPTFVTDEDQPSRFLRPTVADPDFGDDWRLDLVAPPPSAAGMIQTLGKDLRFKPAPDWHGDTNFTLRVCDTSDACSAPQTVPVTVRPVNDAPTLVFPHRVLDEDQAPTWFPLPVTDPDSPGPVRVAIVAHSEAVAVAVDSGAAPRLQLAPRRDATGAAQVSLDLCDADGACAPAVVDLTLKPVNDPPVAAIGTLTGFAGTTSAWVEAAVLDPDAQDSHQLALVTPLPEQLGTLEVAGRRVRLTASARGAGSGTAQLRACDVAGACSSPFTLAVHVVPRDPNCDALQTVQAAVCEPDGARAAAPALAAACWQTATRGLPATAPPPFSDTLLLVTGEDQPSAWLPGAGAGCSCADADCALELVTPPPANAGTLELDGPRLRFVPAPEWSGTATAEIRACATREGCQPAQTVTLLVSPLHDPPRVPAGLVEVDLDAPPATVPAAAIVSDPQAGATAPHFQLLTTDAAAAQGVTITATGILHRDPAHAAAPLDATHLLQVCDAAHLCGVTNLRLRAHGARSLPSLTAPPWVVSAGAPSTWHSFDLHSGDPQDPLQLELVSSTLPGAVEVYGATARVAPVWGWSGEALTQWRVCANGSRCAAPVTVPVRVTPAADGPVFDPVNLTTAEDTPSAWLELAPRQAPPHPPFFLIVDPPPTTGAVETDGTRLRYVPAAEVSGEDTFGLVLCDRAGRCTRQDGRVRVQARNDAPQPITGTLRTREDQRSSWFDLTPLDPDADERFTLDILRRPPAETGSVEVADLQLRFTPAAQWFGATTLTYRVCDAAGACSAETALTLLVTPVGDAPRLQTTTLTLREDAPASWHPLRVDDDDPEDQHTVTLSAVPPELTVQVDGPRVRITPAPNVSGAFRVGITVCDRYQLCTPGTLAVQIDPVADPPEVEDLDITLEQGAAPDWWAPTLRDPDGTESLHLEWLDVPTQGRAEVKGARLRFQPAPDFLGEAVLTFRACDPQGLCSPPARAVLRVSDRNDPPHLADLQLRVAAGETTDAQVDFSDQDPGETHVLRLLQAPGFGQATLTDTQLRYTAPADAAGTTQLVLELCDQKPHCVQQPVPITVTARNHAPTLAPLTLLLPAAPAANPWVPVVIADPDADEAHDLEVVAAPRNGRLELQGTRVRYQATAAVNGEERLTLRACDAQGVCSAPAPFTVRALTPEDQEPPAAADLVLDLPEDGLSPWVELVPGENVSAGLDTLVVELTVPAEHGHCQLSGRRLRYRPAANWSGTDRCGFRLCRTDGRCGAPAHLRVTVTAQPDPPRLGSVALDLLESTTRTVSIPVVDADAGDGQRITLVANDAALALTLTGQQLQITPRATFSGTAHFTLRACDAGGWCTQRTYAVNVVPLPDAPRLTPFTIEIEEDTDSGPVAVPIADADANERFTLRVLTPPEHGRVTVTAGRQPTLTYTPAPDYAGPDDLIVQVCDQYALCNDLPVTVRVMARNDPPRAATLVLRTQQDTSVPFTRPAVSDPDHDDRHRLSIVAPPKQAEVEIGTDLLSLRALPRPGFTGRESFPVRICDLSDACVETQAELVVLPRRQPSETQVILPKIEVVGPSPTGRWPLVTAPLTRDDTGATITGKHTVMLTYAGDGRADLRLGTTRLTPGTQIEIPDYDFDATGGRIALALALAAPATAPDGVIGELTLQVKEVVTATIGAQVTTWNPARLLEIEPTATVVARDVQPLDITVGDVSDYCAGTVLAWTSTAAFPVRDHERGYCAVEWLATPAGLEQGRDTARAHLTGRVTTAESVATLAWRAGLVFFDHLGLPRFFPAAETRQLELQVITPPRPELLFRPDAESPVRGPAGGYWPLPATAIAQISAQAPYPGLTLTIEPVADPAVEGRTVHSTGVTVQADLAELQRPRTYRIAAAYTQAPTLATTAVLTLGEPSSGIALTLHGGPTLTHQANEPLVIQGTLLTFGAPSTTAEGIGRWRVQLLRQAPGGQEVAVGPEVEAGATPFTIELEPQAPGEFLLVAEALDAYGTGQRVHSAPLRVTLVDPGAMPTVTLDADPPQGQTPLATTLTARVSGADLAQLASVTWERAHGTQDYTVIATMTAPQLRLSLPLLVREPGTYHYRVRLTLRGSERHTHSAPLTVHAFDIPTLRVQGYPETLLGQPVNWAVLAPAPDQLEYQWDSPALGGDARGASVRLVADNLGRQPVTVRAKYRAAPDIPAAWATWSGSLLVAPPFLRAPTITGPTTLYEGQVYRFVSPQEPVLEPTTPFASRVLRVWRLPNGRVTTGDAVVFTAGADDAFLDYSAWVDDHEAATRITSRMPLHTHARPWPRWLLQKRVVREQTPARVYYALVPETPKGMRDLRLGQDLRYNLELPDGGRVVAQDRHTALVQFDIPGSYGVRWGVSDAQGRQQTVVDQLAIVDPPPLLASVSPTFTDPRQHAPLDVTLRWSVAGLAPEEKVRTVQLWLNDELLREDPPATTLVHLPMPGEQVVILRVSTTQDRSTETRTVIHARPAAPPVILVPEAAP